MSLDSRKKLVVVVVSTWREPAQTQGEHANCADCVIVWEHLEIPLEEQEIVAGEDCVWNTLFCLLPLNPR